MQKVEENSSVQKLKSLSPKVITGKGRDNITPYLDLIKETLDSKDITNIAITGP